MEAEKMNELLVKAVLPKDTFYCKNRVFVDNYHGTHCTFPCVECLKGSQNIQHITKPSNETLVFEPKQSIDRKPFYNLSKDYKQLLEHLRQGHKIIAYKVSQINKQADRYPPNGDLCTISRTSEKAIGFYGQIGYLASKTRIK